MKSVLAITALLCLSTAARGGDLLDHYDGGIPAASLSPLFEHDDCESIPRLSSALENSPDVAVEKLEGNIYRLTDRGEDTTGDRAAIDVCAAHMNGALFFDAMFQVIRDGKPLFSDDSFWLPLHFIGKIEIDYDSVHFRTLDSERFDELSKRGLVCSRDSIIVLDKADLQKLMAGMAADPSAFGGDFRAGTLEYRPPEEE